nr:PREDICTED: uncharacterized protein LOC108205634 isoform X2 [Daucus carota subsp. sativus]
MACGKLTTHFSPHLISSRTNRSPFSVRISGRINGFLARADRSLIADAPSCIFVGPIETASKETLEALYRQAREAYYNGKPLIVDDMFDRIELKLRWYGSKDVVKYPRCSLRRQSTYADAEEDPSQVFALASVWLLFLCIGGTACLVPLVHTIAQAYQEALSSGYMYDSEVSEIDNLAILNGMLFMVLGSMIGYPVALASVGALKRLWKNDLVALKGSCPNCGEEQSITSPGRQWVYGRIYLKGQRNRSRLQV